MVSIKQRRFNFFDEITIKDPQEPKKNFDSLKNLNIKFCQSGRDLIILGTDEGSIVTLDKHMGLNTFQLFDNEMTCLSQFKNDNIIIAGGHDSSNQKIPLIKILRLDKMDEPNFRPLTISLNNAISKITALAVHDGNNSVCVGLSSGDVLFYKCDILKYKNEKPRILYTGSSPITGISFKNLGRGMFVFVSTEYLIITITFGNREKDEKIAVLADDGVKPRCWCMTDKGELVAARKDAVYVYEHDGVGPCYPFEGDKISVHWFKGKLVIAAKEIQNKSKAPMPTATIDSTTVSIYDVENKYVGFSRSFTNVLNIVCEWSSVYVLAGKGEQIIQLTEKDTQSKLQILFKKNHYQMAIDLAQSSQYDREGVIDIIRQYADHLYSKGDFDKAMSQYIKTIPFLEPSYIIRRFLDSQRIVNLTEYLQELHKQKLANEDHTTLLLNCYTKLKDEQRLNSFLVEGNVEFDVDTGIKVLRQSGFYKQALNLCKKHSKHEDYLKIQLENLKDYGESLNYIQNLDDQSAVLNLKKYGKLLMANIPEKTVEFLKNIYSVQKFVADPTDFLHIFLMHSELLIEFLEFIQKKQINSKIISNTLLELYLKRVAETGTKNKKNQKLLIEDAMNENILSSNSSLSIQEKYALEFLMSNDTSYDMSLALTLCQLHQFKAGLLYLYEKNAMYQRILQYHMDNNDHISILDTCKRYGIHDPNLWIQSLQYFSKRDGYNLKDFIMQILTNIEKFNLLTPLMVIKILSQNNTLTIDTVKEYLLNRMKKEEHEIKENQDTLNRYLKSIMEMKTHIDHLKTEPIIFQANKCESCGDELNFPSIHCLCNHSFHAECFENHSVDGACPTCAVENSNFLNHIKLNEESKKTLHDGFHKQLERSIDTFEVIADYFGKGLFNKTLIVPESLP
ncbi:vacuolar sorting-associated 11 -like protein [Brachionus plicatilis]|uniref:Vacuolar protein sorting-associated protein 11 homolog n=1 Tax=Brachionus plicatilis TaxID=10195 RepID=A0A3M7R4J7_BRAPC|nr:vacuolar sorting-associated 11 -like protein [Brachionus plicatilis]